MSRLDLTAERVRSALFYEPETGSFTWLVSTSNRVKVGAVAGNISPFGYLYISLDGHRYKAHRLAFLYMHGVWPTNHIDHLDGNPANNRIENLRDVSHSVNMQNIRKAKSSNKSTGMLGSYRIGKRFQAKIVIDGKVRHIGMFDTPELAHAAYLAAKRLHHHGCTI
jgi:hypothetical protein